MIFILYTIDKLIPNQTTQQKINKIINNQKTNKPKDISKMSQNTFQGPSLHNDNPQKQIKLSKIQHFKQNSLKGSIVRSVCQSSQSIQQLVTFFKNYQANDQYIDIKKLHTSPHLKLKKYKESVYYGDFINGKRHGQGIMIYNQGTFILGKDNQLVDLNLVEDSEKKLRIYEGQWQNDFKHGKGLQKFANGTIFEGFYVNGKPEGIGRYAWPNGEFYEGQWLNGMKHGSGMWKGAKGDSYVGEWKFGKADGYGVHTWINGDRYEGEFKDCVKHGQGLQRFANGDIYKGFYAFGKPSGFGQYYWTNGSYFKGSFRAGLRYGQGIWKKGPGNTDKYEGEYLNDKKSGFGIFTWASGNIYKGNYENDSRNGNGQMYWTDGSYYKGEWQNGIQHGKGQIYVPGEDLKKGIFQNNTLVHIEHQQYTASNDLSKDQEMYQSKELQSKANTISGGNKTRQTFRSRAYSTNNKSSKAETRPIRSENEARVFKLSTLKSNTRGFGTTGHQTSFQRSSNENNTRGFIRFGVQLDDSKKKRNFRSIESQSKKDRIMHSAFYMHKFHNEMERGPYNSRASQFDRSTHY